MGIDKTRRYRLPCWKYPSDHFALGARFEMKNIGDGAEIKAKRQEIKAEITRLCEIVRKSIHNDRRSLYTQYFRHESVKKEKYPQECKDADDTDNPDKYYPCKEVSRDDTHITLEWTGGSEDQVPPNKTKGNEFTVTIAASTL